MNKTIHQQIATLEARLARAKSKQKKAQARVTYIVGDALLSAALATAHNRKMTLDILRAFVQRPQDVEAIGPLLAELEQGSIQHEAHPVGEMNSHG